MNLKDVLAAKRHRMVSVSAKVLVLDAEGCAVGIGACAIFGSSKT